MNISKISWESLTELTDRELTTLSKSDLNKVINRLSYVANKRLQRLSKTEVFSPAYEGFKRRGEGIFTSKGKNEFELKKEFLRVKEFLKMETSTVHGSQAVRREVRSTLKKDYGIKITNKQYNDFFRAYERLKEIDETIKRKTMKYNVFEEIRNVMNINEEKLATMDSDDVVDFLTENIKNKITSIYEQSVEVQNSEFSKFLRTK